ncbi:MAG TPA: N-acetyltransferase family protein [Geobacteraceae bacterium]|nr:N-acetyltransferase family protein [Geobacteraceae bacterium]
MDPRFEPLTPEDRVQVMDIFNHYVENSFAAYPEQKVPYEFFDMFLRMSEGYPSVVAKDSAGDVLGFGMLRAYSPIPAFSGTAEITYFIKPGYTGKGIGVLILGLLIDGAKKMGLTSILASISSLNQGSIRFHEKNGFVQCGTFREIGRKSDRVFDVVWMQKML